ncbi:hypothetical protein B0I37DRAFT_363755 [Chaetomium sp. MPI-CAGE-AT-0009]|nr:hypothetical protein B0I37DRAFT_363755 [Chaetomium sp. MPI-CAGE-AT-0009]
MNRGFRGGWCIFLQGEGGIHSMYIVFDGLGDRVVHIWRLWFMGSFTSVFLISVVLGGGLFEDCFLLLYQKGHEEVSEKSWVEALMSATARLSIIGYGILYGEDKSFCRMRYHSE